MGWIILICFIILVLAFLFNTGIDFDWTDFFPF